MKLTNYQLEREQKTQAEFESVLAQLRDLGVSELSLSYNGEGDEGLVEIDEPLDLPTNLNHKITEWAHHVLPGGWEINDGSSGTITLDVTTGTGKIEYYEREVTTLPVEIIEVGHAPVLP